ncbi:YncE family protein [Candidatus Neomarinimicrobiota bacterium]
MYFLKFRPRYLILLVALSIYSCDEDNITDSQDLPVKRLYVYSNSGNTVYAVDYGTFEIVDTISFSLPDSIQSHRICLSTDGDHIVFNAVVNYPPYDHIMGSYYIPEDSTYGYFRTGFDTVTGPRLTAAHIKTEPGLVYLVSQTFGIILVDFLAGNVANYILPEIDRGISREIYFSPDNQYTTIVKTYIPLSWGAYSEIEFYSHDSKLQDLLFTLNEQDRDSIYISDMVFSENSEFLYTTYRLSRLRSRYIQCYYGKYAISQKEFYPSPIKLPWSLNPYYMTYSPKRSEVYTVGAYDTLYVIDADNSILKDKIVLHGKSSGPSRIVLRPDENIAFLSCAGDNRVLVISLETRRVLGSIALPTAYRLLIP